MTDTWEKQIDFDFEWGRSILMERGLVVPMLIMHADKPMIVSLGNVPDERMMETRAVLKMLALAHNVRAVSFIAEAWVRKLAKRPGESEAEVNRRGEEGPRPSEAEDRSEAVIAAIFWRNATGQRQTLARMGEIDRGWDGKVKGLLPLDDMVNAHAKSPWAEIVPPVDVPPEIRERVRKLIPALLRDFGFDLDIIEVEPHH